jgi:hypothetical protein
MNGPTETTPTRSVWQQGLLLALLAWLLTSFLQNQTFNSARPYESPPLPTFLHLAPQAWEQVWFFACVACLLAAVGCMARAADIAFDDAAPLGTMLIVGYYNRPMGISVSLAQLNLPLLAILCVAYLADRENRPFRMAAALAAAALIQPWMLGLLLYLLIRRRPVAFLFGVAIFAGLLALLVAGGGHKDPASAIQYVVQSFRLDLAGYENQSILGFARVHFGPNPDAQPLVDNPIVLYAFTGLGLLAVLGGLWQAFRLTPATGSEHSRLQLGLLVMSLLLVLPVCQRAWFVLALPAIWTLLASDAMSAVVRGTTMAAYAIFTRSFPVPRQTPGGLASLGPSGYFLAAAALWLILLVAVDHAGRRPAEPLTL